MLFGHRNDIDGYGRALEAVDRWLPDLNLCPGDMLILGADHGCDPSTPSTDHSREYTPLLVYGEQVAGVNVHTRNSLADVGATVAEVFGATLGAGHSFLQEISD
jgi:phosphopentomutase